MPAKIDKNLKYTKQDPQKKQIRAATIVTTLND